LGTNLTTHTSDSSIHYAQSAISITASQVSDFETEVTDVIADNLPVGSFILWGSDTIPSKYLLVNQASLSRTTYSQLFSVIGTAFGAADSNSFNLPPSGAFIRITAGGSGNDPDRNSRTASAPGGNTGDNVGSFQSDEIKSHRHALNYPNENDENQGFPASGFKAVWATDRNVASGSDAMLNTGGNETRPVNVNFNLIVKYTV
jgi:microcystin-dependent protein